MLHSFPPYFWKIRVGLGCSLCGSTWSIWSKTRRTLGKREGNEDEVSMAVSGEGNIHTGRKTEEVVSESQLFFFPTTTLPPLPLLYVFHGLVWVSLGDSNWIVGNISSFHVSKVISQCMHYHLKREPSSSIFFLVKLLAPSNSLSLSLSILVENLEPLSNQCSLSIYSPNPNY